MPRQFELQSSSKGKKKSIVWYSPYGSQYSLTKRHLTHIKKCTTMQVFILSWNSTTHIAKSDTQGHTFTYMWAAQNCLLSLLIYGDLLFLYWIKYQALYGSLCLNKCYLLILHYKTGNFFLCVVCVSHFFSTTVHPIYTKTPKSWISSSKTGKKKKAVLVRHVFWGILSAWHWKQHLPWIRHLANRVEWGVEWWGKWALLR